MTDLDPRPIWYLKHPLHRFDQDVSQIAIANDWRIVDIKYDVGDGVTGPAVTDSAAYLAQLAAQQNDGTGVGDIPGATGEGDVTTAQLNASQNSQNTKIAAVEQGKGAGLLTGTADPVNDTTTAWRTGQLYENVTTGARFRSTTASTTPETSAAGSVWVATSSPGGRPLTTPEITATSGANYSQTGLVSSQLLDDHAASRRDRYRGLLTGSGVPVDDTTKAWFVGQVYENLANGNRYVASTASTSPLTSANGSRWISAIGSVGTPLTATEIAATSGANFNKQGLVSPALLDVWGFSRRDRFRGFLNGAGAPVNGTTVAWFVGQRYQDDVTGLIYRATQISSNPHASGADSLWVPVATVTTKNDLVGLFRPGTDTFDAAFIAAQQADYPEFSSEEPGSYFLVEGSSDGTAGQKLFGIDLSHGQTITAKVKNADPATAEHWAVEDVPADNIRYRVSDLDTYIDGIVVTADFVGNGKHALWTAYTGPLNTANLGTIYDPSQTNANQGAGTGTGRLFRRNRDDESEFYAEWFDIKADMPYQGGTGTGTDNGPNLQKLISALPSVEGNPTGTGNNITKLGASYVVFTGAPGANRVRYNQKLDFGDKNIIFHSKLGTVELHADVGAGDFGFELGPSGQGAVRGFHNLILSGAGVDVHGGIQGQNLIFQNIKGDSIRSQALLRHIDRYEFENPVTRDPQNKTAQQFNVTQYSIDNVECINCYRSLDIRATTFLQGHIRKIRSFGSERSPMLIKCVGIELSDLEFIGVDAANYDTDAFIHIEPSDYHVVADIIVNGLNRMGSEDANVNGTLAQPPKQNILIGDSHDTYNPALSVSGIDIEGVRFGDTTDKNANAATNPVLHGINVQCALYNTRIDRCTVQAGIANAVNEGYAATGVSGGNIWGSRNEIANDFYGRVHSAGGMGWAIENPSHRIGIDKANENTNYLGDGFSAAGGSVITQDAPDAFGNANRAYRLTSGGVQSTYVQTTGGTDSSGRLAIGFWARGGSGANGRNYLHWRVFHQGGTKYVNQSQKFIQLSSELRWYSFPVGQLSETPIDARVRIYLPDADEDAGQTNSEIVAHGLKLSPGEACEPDLPPASSIAFDASAELTIEAGEITIPNSTDPVVYYRIDTEANAATDILGKMNGGVAGMFGFFRPVTSSRTIEMRHTSADFRLTDNSTLLLDHSRSVVGMFCEAPGIWTEVAYFGNNGSRLAAHAADRTYHAPPASAADNGKVVAVIGGELGYADPVIFGSPRGVWDVSVQTELPTPINVGGDWWVVSGVNQVETDAGGKAFNGFTVKNGDVFLAISTTAGDFAKVSREDLPSRITKDLLDAGTDETGYLAEPKAIADYVKSRLNHSINHINAGNLKPIYHLEGATPRANYVDATDLTLDLSTMQDDQLFELLVQPSDSITVDGQVFTNVSTQIKALAFFRTGGVISQIAGGSESGAFLQHRLVSKNNGYVAFTEDVGDITITDVDTLLGVAPRLKASHLAVAIGAGDGLLLDAGVNRISFRVRNNTSDVWSIGTVATDQVAHRILTLSTGALAASAAAADAGAAAITIDRHEVKDDEISFDILIVNPLANVFRLGAYAADSVNAWEADVTWLVTQPDNVIEANTSDITVFSASSNPGTGTLTFDQPIHDGTNWLFDELIVHGVIATSGDTYSFPFKLSDYTFGDLLRTSFDATTNYTITIATATQFTQSYNNWGTYKIYGRNTIGVPAVTSETLAITAPVGNTTRTIYRERTWPISISPSASDKQFSTVPVSSSDVVLSISPQGDMIAQATGSNPAVELAETDAENTSIRRKVATLDYKPNGLGLGGDTVFDFGFDLANCFLEIDHRAANESHVATSILNLDAVVIGADNGGLMHWYDTAYVRVEITNAADKLSGIVKLTDISTDQEVMEARLYREEPIAYAVPLATVSKAQRQISVTGTVGNTINNGSAFGEYLTGAGQNTIVVDLDATESIDKAATEAAILALPEITQVTVTDYIRGIIDFVLADTAGNVALPITTIPAVNGVPSLTLYNAAVGGGIPTATTDLADIGFALDVGDEILLQTDIGLAHAVWTGSEVTSTRFQQGGGSAVNTIRFSQTGTVLRFRGNNSSGTLQRLKVVR